MFFFLQEIFVADEQSLPMNNRYIDRPRHKLRPGRPAYFIQLICTHALLLLAQHDSRLDHGSKDQEEDSHIDHIQCHKDCKLVLVVAERRDKVGGHHSQVQQQLEVEDKVEELHSHEVANPQYPPFRHN
jgi:hypothetical protein